MIALSLGITDPAGARTLGWGLNAESLRVRDDPAMQTIMQIRDHLRAYVDRERSARIARLQRDLNPPRAPLIGDWSTLMEKREREYRIFGRLQTLAAEEGFEAGYDSELDARLKQEGFSLTERGAIRRRIENGYLRDLGRPDETGRLTPPRAYLQTMLTSMNEPVTEAGLNRCLRGLAALSGHVSREFASTYAEARADPREAWANLSAMRAKGEVPATHWAGPSRTSTAPTASNGATSKLTSLPRRSRRWTMMRDLTLAKPSLHPLGLPNKMLCPAGETRPPPRRRLLIKRIALRRSRPQKPLALRR